MSKEAKKSKETNMYFVCSKIRVLLSQNSCEFNRTKNELSFTSIICKNCPAKYRDERILYSEKEILENKHHVELEEVLTRERKLISPTRMQTELLENLDVVKYLI